MQPRTQDLDFLATILLVGCCLFWGLQQVLVKVTIPEVAPVFQAAIRFVLATVVIVLWAILRGKRIVERDGTLIAGLAAGSLFALEFVGIYVGLQNTSVSRLTIFLYTAPLWVAGVLPFVVRSERLNRVQQIGLLLAFAGVIVAAHDGITHGGRGWVGDVMGIIAGAAFGLTTVVIRSTRLVHIAPEKVLLYQVGVSAVTLPLVSRALGETWQSEFTPFALGSIAVQTLVGAFASYLIWAWMIGRYSATKISSFTFLVPVFALAGGVVFLNEPLTASLAIAFAGVATGIILVNRRA